MYGKKKFIRKLLSLSLCAAVIGGTAAIVPAAISQSVIEVSAAQTVRSPESVALSMTTASVDEGKSIRLSAKVLPDDAENKTVRWSSSNTNTATVSNGLVKGIKAGTVTITAKTANGKTASCAVTVNAVPKKLVLSKSTLTIINGTSKPLKATVYPSKAANKTVTWRSSDKRVATVDSTGVVTAKSSGTASITAKTFNGVTAVCTVKVVTKPSAVSLNMTKASVTAGKTITLKAQVLPKNSDNKTVIWRSGNTKIATVSNGVVKGLKAGTVKITAKTVNGKTAVCTVTVKAVPSKIVLSSKSLTVINGRKKTLKATVYPSKAANKTVTWTTSDKSVAEVSSLGVITGKGSGTATITAKTFNGVTASCIVKVITKPSSVSLDKTEAKVEVGKSISLTATVLPENTDNKTVIWRSSNNNIAAVKDGVVTGIKAGTATITARTINGMTAVCTVKVDSNVKELLRAEAKKNGGIIALNVWCNGDDLRYYNDKAEEFKKKYSDPTYEISINISSKPTDYVSRDLINDPISAADVFLINSDAIPHLADSGALSKVTGDNAAALNEYMTENAIQTVKYKNSIYGYPVCYDGYYMIYDKRYLSESDIKSLDMMISKAYKQGKSVYFNLTNSGYSASFYLAAGVKLKYENGKQYADFYSESGFAAADAIIHHYSRSADKGLIVYQGRSGDSATAYSGFASGKFCAAVTWGGMSNIIIESIGKENIGYAKLPTAMINGKQTQLCSFLDTKVFCTKSVSKCPVASRLFASFLTSPESLIDYAETRTPAVTLKSAAAEPVVKAIMEQMPYSYNLNSTVGPVYWGSGIADIIGSVHYYESETVFVPNDITDAEIWKKLKQVQVNIDDYQ